MLFTFHVRLIKDSLKSFRNSVVLASVPSHDVTVIPKIYLHKRTTCVHNAIAFTKNPLAAKIPQFHIHYHHKSPFCGLYILLLCLSSLSNQAKTSHLVVRFTPQIRAYELSFASVKKEPQIPRFHLNHLHITHHVFPVPP